MKDSDREKKLWSSGLVFLLCQAVMSRDEDLLSSLCEILGCELGVVIFDFTNPVRKIKISNYSTSNRSTRRKHSCRHRPDTRIKSLLQIWEKREGGGILRQLWGGALSYLLGSLLQASFGQTGEPSVAFRGDVRVKDSSWEGRQTELWVNRSVIITNTDGAEELVVYKELLSDGPHRNLWVDT